MDPITEGFTVSASVSKLDDPQWRRDRASKAAKAAHSPQNAARKLVESWPTLDEATRAEVRALLVGAEVRAALLATAEAVAA